MRIRQKGIGTIIHQLVHCVDFNHVTTWLNLHKPCTLITFVSKKWFGHFFVVAHSAFFGTRFTTHADATVVTLLEWLLPAWFVASRSVTGLTAQFCALKMLAFPITWLCARVTGLSALFLADYAMSAFVVTLLLAWWTILGTHVWTTVATKQCFVTLVLARLVKTTKQTPTAISCIENIPILLITDINYTRPYKNKY